MIFVSVSHPLSVHVMHYLRKCCADLFQILVVGCLEQSTIRLDVVLAHHFDSDALSGPAAFVVLLWIDRRLLLNI